eukprot:6458967-Amphidinium_carterae.1
MQAPVWRGSRRRSFGNRPYKPMNYVFAALYTEDYEPLDKHKTMVSIHACQLLARAARARQSAE